MMGRDRSWETLVRKGFPTTVRLVLIDLQLALNVVTV